MQQALEYAEILDIPFAYSSNGDAFLEHDRTVIGGTVTREIPLDRFSTHDELWQRYRKAKGYTAEQIERIVAKVEQLMTLVDALETQLATFRATAANLLPALVAELTNN